MIVGNNHLLTVFAVTASGTVMNKGGTGLGTDDVSPLGFWQDKLLKD